MTDDREALETLNPEQAAERIRAGLLELEYWRQVLTDLHDLHDGVHAVAGELERSTLSVLGLLPLVHSVGVKPLETIVEANKTGLEQLHAMQRKLIATLELVDGRSVASRSTLETIAASFGLELDDDDDQT